MKNSSLRSEGRGNPVYSAFGIPDAPTLRTKRLNGSVLAATELRFDEPNFGITKPMPAEEAFLVAVQLRDCPDHELYFDGRGIFAQGQHPSST